MKDGIKIWIAVALTIFGMVMLGVSLYLPPQGEIHPSVLAAVGEVFTFAGSVFGIKLNYDLKMKRFVAEEEERHRKGKEKE